MTSPKPFVSTLDTLSGDLRFDGTRISVEQVGRLVAAGESYGVLLEDYPSLMPEDLDAAGKWWRDIGSQRPARAAGPLKFVRGK